MTHYSIDDQHGTNICSGIQSERRARELAQDHADRLGANVLLYSSEPGDDGEVVEPTETDEPALACRDYDPGAPHERMTR